MDFADRIDMMDDDCGIGGFPIMNEIEKAIEVLTETFCNGERIYLTVHGVDVDLIVNALRSQLTREQNEPLRLKQLLNRIHAMPSEGFVGRCGNRELVETVKDCCCEAIEEAWARLPQAQ